MAKHYGVKELVNLFINLIKPITDAYKDEVGTNAEPKKIVATEAAPVEVKAEPSTPIPLPVVVAPVLLTLGIIAPPKSQKATAKPRTTPKTTKAPKVMMSAAQTTKKPKKATPKPKRWTVAKIGGEWTATNGTDSQTYKTRDQARAGAKERNE